MNQIKKLWNTFVVLAAMLVFLPRVLLGRAMLRLACYATGPDLHIDAPLSNVAVEAFNDATEFIAPLIFPAVPVAKQSNVYYVIGKNSWLKVPQSTLRAPGTSPRRVAFDVSSDNYFANNFALAGEVFDEDAANADDPIQLWERTVRFTTRMLMRDFEVRAASIVTSISNVGSGVILSGANKWSNFAGSNPIADVGSGAAFIRGQTGIVPNTLFLDWDTHQVLKRHPVILDMFKYTAGGQANDDQLKSVFNVKNMYVADAIQNTAPEAFNVNSFAISNIWGNMAFLAFIDANAPTLKTQTFGLGMQWRPENMPAPMQAMRYRDPDAGKKMEIVEVGYYQAEKIVAQQLGYLIKTTL